MSLLPWANAIDSDPEEVENPNDLLATQDTTVAHPDFATDEQAIAEDTFNQIADRVPGWQAHDGNLDVWLVEAFARVAAEIRWQAANIPDAIFATFGQEILGIPIQAPAPATGTSTWTAVDTQGYTIPAGTVFTLARTGDHLVAFEAITAAQIPQGQTSVAGVQIRALDDGVSGNGLSGAGDVVDPLMWVEAINVPSITGGGTDGQTVDEYLNGGLGLGPGLVSLMRVIALRPILPGDFAILALLNPAVGRAIALDLYDPATQTWNNERTITLILTDPNGNALPSPGPPDVKADVKAYLESLREVNFVVHVIDASYQPVNVTYTVTTFAGANPATVQQACDWQLQNFLSPANYRLGTTSPAISAGEVIMPPQAGQDPARRYIRINDIIGLLDRTRGVDFVNDGGVTINGTQADYELPTATTLPTVGTITGTVNEG